MNIKKIYFRIKWLSKKRKLRHIGTNSHVDGEISFKGMGCISIGDNFSAGKYVKIHAFSVYNGKPTGKEPSIQIGNNVTLTERCYISCANQITIEDGVLMGENSFICDNYHGSPDMSEIDIPPRERQLCVKDGVHIGKNVWVGRNVCIMPGVNIGDGSIIGANAVVTKDIPKKSVAVGVPAKVIKQVE